MFRTAATRRVGVLAYTFRTREYARRVFRSLGYAPRVLVSLDELAAMGPDASTLDMLLLGDVPPTDAKGRMILERVCEVVGPGVPVLLVGMQKAGCVNPHVATAGVVTASPRFFGDLFLGIVSFLDAVGLERPPPRLSWGEYSFDPARTVVAFANRETRLDAVAFDIALELFFHAGRTVTKKELSLMLPSDEEGAARFRIQNIGSVIKELRSSLRLRDLHGWQLETLPHVGYRLMRAGIRSRMEDPSRGEVDSIAFANPRHTELLASPRGSTYGIGQ
jgi:DNA-binding winged helix-turn-helix (wHTH) protein